MSHTNKKKEEESTSGELRSRYDQEYARAGRISSCIKDEISALLPQMQVALAVPIESRVKDWSSILEKINRKSIIIRDILDLPDFVGLRLILLFKKDLNVVDKIVRDNFHVVSVEDTSERLDDSQFGYQSQHYIIKIKDEWLAVPRYKDLGGMTVELQVRTLAQHMWAAASHKLQYKREESVPLSLRRAIYRVSALLETVDLEFDRVLDERAEYIEVESEAQRDNIELNVDLVNLIARDVYPSINYDSTSDGADEILLELKQFGILRSNELRELLEKSFDEVMVEDRKAAVMYSDSEEVERVAQGAYFNHIGLIRQAIISRYGKNELRRVMEDIGTGSGRKKRPLQ